MKLGSFHPAVSYVLSSMFWLLLATCEGHADDAVVRVERKPHQGFPEAVIVSGKPLIHTAQFFSRNTTEPTSVQMNEIVEELLRTIQAISGKDNSASSLIKLNLYGTDEAAISEAVQVLRKRFPASELPAISSVVTSLPVSGARIAADLVAVAPPSPRNVERTREASQLGTAQYSILPAGPSVYVSGQAEKGDGSLADATRQTMNSLLKTLEFLKLTKTDVVQLKAFITPMKDASEALKEMKAFFPDETSPPIVLVEWESSLPIEIELIAASPKHADSNTTPALEFITPPWMKSSPVFCRVVRINHPTTLYLAGLYGKTPSPDGVDEVRDLFGSLDQILKQASSDLHHLAKATYYVATEESSSNLNKVRPDYYDPLRPPAASKAKVRGTGRTGRTITLDMIAVPGKAQ